ncbi:MAG: hypothetical protein N2117_08805 [Anaerolineales bacterium]|nr:hypothetical protein [Anaerolineales bacterium]MCX7755333.1 hypothetical protein [Anaerolineales bacterium]MDW8279310.1 hypothetical protein [Anaerolineales bacterium]
MKRRDYLLLFLVGLAWNSAIAWFQHAPGYMDADYYYAGGVRLFQGHGFTEIYLWNYLDNPQTLPHPSHGYWFPLASMVAAAGMWLTGSDSFAAGRLGFVLIAALVPPTSAALAFSFTHKRPLALASGFLGVFCGYHAPFLPTTDNFGIFMLLGALFFLLFPRTERKAAFLLGVIAGLMNLARSDGLLWLAVGGGGLFLRWLQERKTSSFLSSFILPVSLFLLGYALVMGPWMARNLSIWGTPLTPAGNRVLWMTRYDETFAWPPDRVNYEAWRAAGWQAALEARREALQLNVINSIAAQGVVLLAVFAPIGLWVVRNDLRALLAVLAWLALFFVLTFIFPFAGSRGSFFHAAAALQPVWWTAAPIAVEFLVSKARQRGRFTPQAFGIFRFALIAFMGCITLALLYISLIEKDWNEFQRVYQRAEQILRENGARPEDVVIVANAPGYFATNRRPAIIVPDEDLATTRRLARQFGARFLILEKTYYTDPMIPVYQNPYAQPGLTYLGEFDEVRLFRIEP